MLAHMVCSECGEVFDEDLFAEDPGETIVCPMCGTGTLERDVARPVPARSGISGRQRTRSAIHLRT